MSIKTVHHVLTWSSANNYSDAFFVEPGAHNVMVAISAAHTGGDIYMQNEHSVVDANAEPAAGSTNWRIAYDAGATSAPYMKSSVAACITVRWCSNGDQSAFMPPGWTRAYSLVKPPSGLTVYVTYAVQVG